jgi:hypothetical protein
MDYTLLVEDSAGKLVHVERFHSVPEAENELHRQNSYAGGEGRLFRIYHVIDDGPAQLIQRLNTCRI